MTLGGIKAGIKHAFSKEIVMTGVGLFAAQTAFRIMVAKTTVPAVDKDGKAIMKTDGTQAKMSKLPLGNDMLGQILYSIGIPVVIGIASRKFSPGFSNGAYLYAINQLIDAYVAPTINAEVNKIAKVNAGSAYVRYGMSNVANVGRISGRPAIAPVGNLPGYPAIYPQNSMSRR